MTPESLRERRLQLQTTHERSALHHLIISGEDRFDPVEEKAIYDCKNGLGEHWVLNLPADQLVYPSLKSYDKEVLETFLKKKAQSSYLYYYRPS